MDTIARGGGVTDDIKEDNPMKERMETARCMVCGCDDGLGGTNGLGGAGVRDACGAHDAHGARDLRDDFACGYGACGGGHAGETHGCAHDDDPVAFAEFLDTLEPVGESVADDLLNRLREGRRRYGPRRADGEWMEEPMRVWLDCLDKGNSELGMKAMLPLAVGINEVLSMRDALIISVIAEQGTCDLDMLMDIVRTPHAKQVVSVVHKVLSEAFDDRDGPDRDRCRTALRMLASMARVMPERMRVQPLAVISYVMWWTGDCRAEDYALSSLSIDGDCSLAAIVLKSVRNGMHPACCGG